jgi:hypothetical protein
MSYRLSLIPLALAAVVAAACSEGSTSPSTDAAAFASGPGSDGDGSGGGGSNISVTCEKRSSRSKISVDGRNLPSGSYTARVTSGTNSRTSAARRTVGDEVEFDFDSNQNDIAAGATRISANFIQVAATPDVRGEILNAAGAVVRTLGVNCRVR